MMRENFFPTRNSCKNITSNATFFDIFKFWQQSQNICEKKQDILRLINTNLKRTTSYFLFLLLFQ